MNLFSQLEKYKGICAWILGCVGRCGIEIGPGGGIGGIIGPGGGIIGPVGFWGVVLGGEGQIEGPGWDLFRQPIPSPLHRYRAD